MSTTWLEDENGLLDHLVINCGILDITFNFKKHTNQN